MRQFTKKYVNFMVFIINKYVSIRCLFVSISKSMHMLHVILHSTIFLKYKNKNFELQNCVKLGRKNSTHLP